MSFSTSIYDMEHARQWRERALQVPAIKFQPDWSVAIIPPFAGADARFIVKCGKAKVSVYLDFDSRLGCMDEPYWEIYPLGDDTARYLLSEADELVAGIAQSIREQNEPPRLPVDEETDK